MSAIPSALRPSFGYVLIGVLVTSLLHGFTTFQSIAYFRTSSEDSWALKLTVLAVMIIECLHLAFCWHFQWFYFTAALGDPSVLLDTLWSTFLTIPLTMLVVFICHVFFVTKLWKISSHNRILCASIAVLELASVGSQLALSVKLFSVPLWPEVAIDLRSLVSTAFALIVCTDIAIAAGLSYYLIKCRTGYQQTDSIVTQLLYYTVNNGILTTVVDMVMMGLFLGLPNSLAFLAVFEVISKIYVAAILTSLNTRKELRTRYRTGEIEIYGNQGQSGSGSPLVNLPFSSKRKINSRPTDYRPKQRRSRDEGIYKSESLNTTPTVTVVKIDQTIETHVDERALEGGMAQSS
ncbi:hypothetical protein SISSUDRAFT_1127936 [Sistotremastrum suecicum HHB10207 ss-3]|uniref:DUF6534 domain-containing protein n=1 Tax=Sistotremastrum suecicum HHB10207 ss-3 TaxID=1314776 RepID=A0A166EFT0_9AGAM|nr:hypothetical protein SISSUDRAFT_1127936 [Sistotremastrum suecicum HHB10207 ss-3]